MQDDFIDPQLAEDITISRRELAEGKGIPHEVVFAELDKKLQLMQRFEAAAVAENLDDGSKTNSSR